MDPPRIGFQLSSFCVPSDLDSNAVDTPITRSETLESQTEPKSKTRRIGDYVLGKKIGEGAFGKIRLGYHVDRPEESYAIKIISKQHC